MAACAVGSAVSQPWKSSVRPDRHASAQSTSVGNVVEVRPSGGVPISPADSGSDSVPSIQNRYVVCSATHTTCPARSSRLWMSESSSTAIWAGVK